MKTQHTPGPWYVTDHNGRPAVYSGDRLPCCVATCSRQDDGPANAKLIAAAPELLAELRSVREWMQDCMIDTQNKGLPSRDRYDAVVTAIANAESV